MTGANSLIRCDKVAKRFGGKRVLRDISLSVRAGEIFSLLGANGSGKTTLLRIVAGLERSDAGEVWLGPVPLSAARHEIRHYIGVVAHAPLLYDSLTAAENLRFFARMYDLNAPEDRINRLLRAFALWPRRDEPVRTFSRGMLQRLAIARSILHDPPVLIFDEPDSGLDGESLTILSGLLAEFRRGERAVMLSTHDRSLAATWSDRICELRDGRLHPITDSERSESWR